MQVFFSIFWWIYFCIFFSGYPLIYILLYFIHKKKSMYHSGAEKIFSMLPLVYAFVATCFWILMIYTGRMNFVIERIASAAPSAIVILYSFSALLFWLPALRRKAYGSFLHSLPLFMLPFFNMLNRVSRHKIVDHDYIVTLFRIYTAGFITYIIAIIFLMAVKWLLSKTFLLKHYKV